jgi:hypothetical protein
MTAPDYSKLLQETSYEQRMLGNIMFNGKLIQANANFSCFMTINTENPAYMEIPDAYRVCFSLITLTLIYWLIDLLFNAILSNISAISWQPVLVVEEAGVPRENHRPWASNW